MLILSLTQFHQLFFDKNWYSFLNKNNGIRIIHILYLVPTNMLIQSSKIYHQLYPTTVSFLLHLVGHPKHLLNKQFSYSISSNTKQTPLLTRKWLFVHQKNTTHIFNLMRAIFFSLLRFCYFKITSITQHQHRLQTLLIIKWPSEIVTKNQHQNQSLIPIPTQDIPLAHHRIQRYHKRQGTNWHFNNNNNI